MSVLFCPKNCGIPKPHFRQTCREENPGCGLAVETSRPEGLFHCLRSITHYGLPITPEGQQFNSATQKHKSSHATIASPSSFVWDRLLSGQ